MLITGAARGVGALLAKRLTDRGAKVALAGIEPDDLAKVARVCMDAPSFACDVTDRAQVEDAVTGAVEEQGGLDVVVANAGVAAQLPPIGGDPEIFETTMQVNMLGELGIERDSERANDLSKLITDLSLDNHPKRNPGLLETSAASTARGVKVGIICDVGLTPSPVFRKYLQIQGA